jgi:methylenetetrahydrofolate dehydrogenase (NADP+)/methenyltetrahydrofolate cyclohydrolase
MAEIINGKQIAQGLLDALARKIAEISASGKRLPQLAVILVGDDPASQIYVSHKAKACHQVGMKSRVIILAADTSEAEVLSQINELNNDATVDGILLQLPVPPHLSAHHVLAALAPAKDVDGLTPYNQGLLALGHPGLVPCTPLGIIALLDSLPFTYKGSRVVVVGKSSLVGAPVARLLEQRGATVTSVHSQTPDPQHYTRTADLLVVAAGKHHLVGPSWVKPGAVVIDVGIHRSTSGTLQGDVDFQNVSPLTHAITPVPGGVGPMTIACLLSNCFKAYLHNI